MSAEPTKEHVITISRSVGAPRDLVFRAWTEPKHIVHWFHASEGWKTPFAETDICAGGAFRIGFASPDGKNDFVFAGIYNELIPPERIVLTIGDGRPVTVSFANEAEGTMLSLDLTLETTHSAEQQRAGWSAMLENLVKYLNSGTTQP